jgi:hypothetical protein
MRWIVAALLLLATGAAFMAAPEADAARWNAEVRRGCAEMRALGRVFECPAMKREAWDTSWLLIAAVLGVGSAIVGAAQRRQH